MDVHVRLLRTLLHAHGSRMSCRVPYVRSWVAEEVLKDEARHAGQTLYHYQGYEEDSPRTRVLQPKKSTCNACPDKRDTNGPQRSRGKDEVSNHDLVFDWDVRVLTAKAILSSGSYQRPFHDSKGLLDQQSKLS